LSPKGYPSPEVLEIRKKSNNRKKDYKSKEGEHTRKARPSTENKHEEGQTRKARDKGGEKGDARRKRHK